MTLEETKANHIKMWNLMSRLTCEEFYKYDFEIFSIKNALINKMGFREIALDCFLCEYAQNMKNISRGIYTCDYCPAIWKGSISNKCILSFYGDLTELIDHFEYLKNPKQNDDDDDDISNFMQQYKTLCEKIRDITWKE